MIYIFKKEQLEWGRIYASICFYIDFLKGDIKGSLQTLCWGGVGDCDESKISLLHTLSYCPNSYTYYLLKNACNTRIQSLNYKAAMDYLFIGWGKLRHRKEKTCLRPPK